MPRTSYVLSRTVCRPFNHSGSKPNPVRGRHRLKTAQAPGLTAPPAFAQKLAELLPRIVANDREIEYINGHALPSGAGRLLVAELIARGLEGFVKNSVQTPRITEELRLPAFKYAVRDRYAWPRRV